MIEFNKIPLGSLDFNTGQISGLPANPRSWTDSEIKKLAKSMKATPELAEARGCIVVPYGGRFVVLGGNLRLAAAKFLKWPAIMCAVLPEGTKVAKLKEVVLKDNSSFGSWDLSMLRKDWSEFDLSGWGIDVTWDTAGPTPDASVNETPQEEIERMQKEFEERMARGEISEEDEEYQEFLEKFKLKKTTDDCYTPAPVYDAVARYVEETYGVSRDRFVRPFYPGGDYVNEKYPDGCVVVDNPPHIITSTWVGALSRLGIDFVVPVAESECISGLDAQKETGKAIFGKGYIVSDAVVAEREKAEREKAERWTLSERELAIVQRLNRASHETTER